MSQITLSNLLYVKAHSIVTQGQEFEFHEIEIQLFHEIKFLIMRSKFNLFMCLNLFINI